VFGRARRALRRVRVFVTHDLWSLEAGALPTFRALLVWTSRVLFIALRGFRRDRCTFHAAALTYISVLSIVPVLAFSFSMAKGLGAFDTLVENVIEPTLDEVFPEERGVASVAEPVERGGTSVRSTIDKLLQFVEETDVSKLGIFGLAVLLWAVIKLLGSVERSFNQIWGVSASRSIVRKVSDYLAIVVVAPILLITAAAIASTAGSAEAVALLDRWHLGPAVDILMRLVPLVGTWVVFTFVYMCLPNKRMRLSSALLGGVGGGTLWLLLQVAHVKLQIWTANFNALYAGFAAFPIFLVWIYLSWVMVLFGAELASAHRRAPTYRGSAYVGPLELAFKEVIALRVLTRIAESFLRGRAPWTVPALSEEMRVPELWIDDVVETLVEGQILAPLQEERTPGLLPARSLETISVVDVRLTLRGDRGAETFPARNAAEARALHTLERLDEEALDSARNPSLRDLGEEAIRDADAPPAASTIAAPEALS
jgi:membrane protein